MTDDRGHDPIHDPLEQRLRQVFRTHADVIRVGDEPFDADRVSPLTALEPVAPRRTRGRRPYWVAAAAVVAVLTGGVYLSQATGDRTTTGSRTVVNPAAPGGEPANGPGSTPVSAMSPSSVPAPVSTGPLLVPRFVPDDYQLSEAQVPVGQWTDPPGSITQFTQLVEMKDPPAGTSPKILIWGQAGASGFGDGDVTGVRGRDAIRRTSKDDPGLLDLSWNENGVAITASLRDIGPGEAGELLASLTWRSESQPMDGFALPADAPFTLADASVFGATGVDARTTLVYRSAASGSRPEFTVATTAPERPAEAGQSGAFLRTAFSGERRADGSAVNLDNLVKNEPIYTVAWSDGRQMTIRWEGPADQTLFDLIAGSLELTPRDQLPIVESTSG